MTAWETYPETGSWQDVDSWREKPPLEQVSGPVTPWAPKEQAVPEELHPLEGATLELSVKN